MCGSITVWGKHSRGAHSGVGPTLCFLSDGVDFKRHLARSNLPPYLSSELACQWQTS